MTQQTIPQVPLDKIHDPGDIIIGQSQETRIYYRPAKDRDGNDIYIPTTPLPCDAWHLNYYVKKGFKLWPPGEEPDAELQAGLQAKVKGLEARIAELTGDEEVGPETKQAIEAETKVLEEQKASIEGAIVAKPNAISCPFKDCVFIAKTYIGLARHTKTIHDTK